MLTSQSRLIGLVSTALAASALACSTLTPGSGPTAAPLATNTPVLQIATATTVPATDMPAPTDVPATDVAPTAAPAPGLRLVVAAADASAFLVDLQGQVSPITEMQEPLYVLSSALNLDLGAPLAAYNVSSAGVFKLDVVQNVFQGFAAYVGPAAPNGLLAWDSYSIDPNGGGVTSQIHLSSPDGSDQRVVLEETAATALRVWRWAADGQRLYFSREPLGLGGYIPFGGITNIWVLNLADNTTREIAPAGSGIICIDDLSADETLVAHHCADGTASVYSPGQGAVAAIPAPPEAERLLVGDVRLSPDLSRVAFAFALGVPDAEQGWVAVSDGLGSTAHLAAKANAGEFFHVVQWLDADTLLLQSSGNNPGVYRAVADGSSPAVRLADGTLLGVIDNVAGQP
jgi:hypothetical protein